MTMPADITKSLSLLDAVIRDARTLGVATYEADLQSLLSTGSLPSVIGVLIGAGLEVRLRAPPGVTLPPAASPQMKGVVAVADSTVRSDRLRFVVRPAGTGEPRRPPRRRRGGGGRRPSPQT